jgi:hypothetical protein
MTGAVTHPVILLHGILLWAGRLRLWLHATVVLIPAPALVVSGPGQCAVAAAVVWVLLARGVGGTPGGLLGHGRGLLGALLG